MNAVLIIELLMATCIATQGMVVPGTSPLNRTLSCKCIEDDLKCKDACSKSGIAASDNALRIMQIQSPSGTVITKTIHADEKPFVKFVEKKISKNIYGSGYTPNADGGNGSAQAMATFLTDALPTKTSENIVYKGDIASYNGTSYRACDLYDWAAKIRANGQYMSMSDELKTLYNSITENSNLGGMCARKSSVIELPKVIQNIDNKRSVPDTSTEEMPSHSLTNLNEPVIIERNNVIPVFIRDSDVFHNIYPERYTQKDDPRMLLNQDTGVSVSTITLRTTTTTTTTKARLIEQAEDMASKKMKTQTIITTRTITRHPRVSRGMRDLTTTILKTMYVDRDGMDSKIETDDRAESESSAFSAAALENKTKNGFKNKKYKPSTQKLMEFDLLEQIKSLLDSETHNANKKIVTTIVPDKPSIAELLHHQSPESALYTVPHTTTLTISKEHTTTVYKSVPEPSNKGYLESMHKDRMPMEYEDAFKELLKGVSEFMKINKALPSTKESILNGKNVATKKLTTTVVETVTKTKNVHDSILSQSQSIALPSVATVLNIPHASQTKEDEEHSIIMSKYEKKVEELMKRISMNEEREQKLIDMILTMERNKNMKNEQNEFEMIRVHDKDTMDEEHIESSVYLPRYLKHMEGLNDIKKYGAKVPGLHDDRANDIGMYNGISSSKDIDSVSENEDKEAEKDSIKSIMSVLSIERLSTHEFDTKRQKLPKENEHHASAMKNKYNLKSVYADEPEILRYGKKNGKKKIARDISKNDEDRVMIESVVDVLKGLKETLTEHEVVTKTVISTVAKELDKDMHISVVSSVVEDQVRRLERELDGFEEKVEAVVGKKLKEFKMHRNADRSHNDEIVSVVLPVISRSVIGTSDEDTTEKESKSKRMRTRMVTVIESKESISKDASISTVYNEIPKVAYSRIESYVKQPESVCLESIDAKSLDGKSMDDVVLDIKQKKIPNDSLLISDEIVIDEIVEKLTPFVNGINMSSISADQTQNEGESTVASISVG
ncbi:hypothetical protein CWI42_081560 [Ordospora colligata]|uniref:Uncharacterized protein n=1 Tax=Ordospora colligata OC4 TaxID=1354746 RepID=A0A0B2UEA5_9MICR|nr:uncharacterized protein M896_081560 [Ordospora colligata OC4]KHN69416.1 hypothetical protein M896_081560 [Ordospora colligata OC4]TBU14930.1 hypothetical protein CWI41_081550 [Ordospora colligata]TBU15061.1 hypothetical protein CWI40_081570 [Ordospora colligata]TBU18315.1 hypothetical protein CWI42_081560 [Ordospora colligata]